MDHPWYEDKYDIKSLSLYIWSSVSMLQLKKEGDANVEVVAERNNPASSKNVCGTNRKRALRTKCNTAFIPVQI